MYNFIGSDIFELWNDACEENWERLWSATHFKPVSVSSQVLDRI